MPYDSVIPLNSKENTKIPKKTKTLINLKRYMHPYVYWSSTYNSQDTEAAQVSIDWWMDKETVVCMSTHI